MSRKWTRAFAIACVCVAICLQYAIEHVDADALDDEIARKESIVSNIAQRARNLYLSRCSKLSSCADSCTQWACSNVFKWDEAESLTDEDIGLSCSTVLGSNKELCGEDSSGQLLNYEESVMRFPINVSPYEKDMKEMNCASKDLDEVFKTNRQDYNLDIWQYFGFFNGAYRIFPGKSRQHEGTSVEEMARTCRPYDPRLRPWFISAATGPKDIVILVDVSGSMAKPASHITAESRLQVLQGTLDQLIGTFAFTDYINVVKFSSTASTLTGGNKLVQGTAQNIQNLREQIKNLGAEAKTNFETGFRVAFDLLDQAMGSTSDDASSSNCEKVILFLTDGDRTEGGDPHPYIESRQQQLENHSNCQSGARCRASIFTFTMGSDITVSGETDLKRIACSHNGVWASVSDGEDPLTDMSSYFKFLAIGGGNEVRWTTPYYDDGGLGLMTTAAAPAYDGQGLLIGVAGVDFLMKDLNSLADDTRVLSSLIAESNQCRSYSLSKCQLQLLRQSSSQLAICPTDSAYGDNVNVNTCIDSDTVILEACAGDASNDAVCTLGSTHREYEETSCCKDFDKPGVKVWVIAVAVIGASTAILVCFSVKSQMNKKRNKPNAPPPQSVPSSSPAQASPNVIIAAAPAPVPVIVQQAAPQPAMNNVVSNAPPGYEPSAPPPAYQS